jgi:thiol-disulfide isomerase/thioredoxin
VLADLVHRVEPLAEVTEQGSLAVRERRSEVGNHVERLLQRAEVAGVRPAPGDPGDEPLDVVDGPEVVVESLARRDVADEFLDGVVSRRDVGLVEQRAAEPVLEAASTERAGRLVDRAEQRRAVLAVDRAALEQFERAQGDRVQKQVLAGVVAGEVVEVVEPVRLARAGVLRVGEQRPARPNLGVARQQAVRRAEVPADLFAGRSEVEGGRPERRDHRVRVEQVGVDSGGDDGLRGGEAVDLVRDGLACPPRRVEVARRHVEHREPEFRTVAPTGDARDEVVVLVEERVLGERPGCDDSGDCTVDDARGLRGVLHLVGDGHPVARVEQRLDVALGVVDRDARHRVPARRVLAFGERYLEQAGGALRGLAERLVEISHLEEHQGVGVLLAEFEILGHHRGQVLPLLGHRLRRSQCRVHVSRERLGGEIRLGGRRLTRREWCGPALEIAACSHNCGNSFARSSRNWGMTTAKPTRLADESELDAFVADHDLALVEFYTEGCAMCAAMEPVLGNVAKATEVAVGMANPRDDPPLVDRFDVRSVPLLLLFRDGELAARKAEGFQGASDVVAFLEEHSQVTVA